MFKEKLMKIGELTFLIASNCSFRLPAVDCQSRESCKSAYMALGDYKCPLGVIRDMSKIYIQEQMLD